MCANESLPGPERHEGYERFHQSRSHGTVGRSRCLGSDLRARDDRPICGVGCLAKVRPQSESNDVS